MQNHSAGTAYSGPRWGEVRFHSQGQWILTLTLLNPRFWSTFVQYSLNVLAFLLISHVEIRLTDRQERIASLQPENLTLNVKEMCSNTMCFSHFQCSTIRIAPQAQGNVKCARLERTCPAACPALPGTSPAIPVPPCHVTVGLF